MTTPKTTRKTRTPAGSAAIKTKKIVKRVELPPNPFIHEILDHVEEQKTKAKKIAELKKYRDDSLTAILIWNFDSSVISAVPEGQVPYTGFDEQNTYTGGLSAKISEEVRRMHEQGGFSLGAADGQGHTTIRKECRHFYRFVRGGDDGLNNLRSCLLYTSPSPRDRYISRMPSSA